MMLPIKVIGHNTQCSAQKTGLEQTSLWFSKQISTAPFPGQFSDSAITELTRRNVFYMEMIPFLKLSFKRIAAWQQECADNSAGIRFVRHI